MQLVVKESDAHHPSLSFAQYEQILHDIQHKVHLLQTKLAEHEQKQVVMAQDYGMLVRKPYLGYRYVKIIPDH